MHSLLVINPNTTAAVTALLRARAEAAAPPGAVLHVVQARFGAPYINDEASAAVAAHAVLDAAARHEAEYGAPGAMLIGCFGDPGLFALRAAAGVPVLGLAEASMQTAARIAAPGRFGIVTGGAGWPPMLKRLAHALELDGALGEIAAVTPDGGSLMADRPAALALLHAACHDALRRSLSEARPLQALLLGGAALAGWAPLLAEREPRLGVPVLCSVHAALHAAWAAAGASTEPRPGRWPPWLHAPTTHPPPAPPA